MEKWPTSIGTRTNCGGSMKDNFLTTPLRLVETLSLIRTQEPHMWWTNDRATYQVITGSIGLKVGTHSAWVKKPRSCGPSGTKQWQFMNGGLALHWHLSLSNSSFAFLTQVSQSSINFGIAFKLGGHGDGPCLSCTNYVGLELVTMIVLIGSMPCLGKGFLRNIIKRSRFGTSLGVLYFGPFGLSATTKCSTMNVGIESKAHFTHEPRAVTL